MPRFPNPKKSQRWGAALGPTPVYARSVDRDVRARSNSARARNVAFLPKLRARAQLVQRLAMVHAPHERSRGSLRDHYLSRRKCANVAFIFFLNLILRPHIYSFYSPTLSVRGERPCCGIMIGESFRSSHSSSSELLVSPHLPHVALATP